MSATEITLDQTIDKLIEALEPLSADERKTVLQAVCTHFQIQTPDVVRPVPTSAAVTTGASTVSDAPPQLRDRTNTFSCTDGGDYTAFAVRAALDDTAFRRFRRELHEKAHAGIEATKDEYALHYCHFLEQFSPDLLDRIGKFRSADAVGDPYVPGKTAPVSVVVLRYIKVLCDLQKLFGDLTEYRIIEIGCGFGGQCKVIADGSGFRSYTLASPGNFIAEPSISH